MTPERVREAFAYQARACGSLGSPFMERLCGLLAVRDWPVGSVRDRVFAWEGEIGPRDQSVPLRLAGALHALRLRGDPVLAAVYPPGEAAEDALWAAVSDRLVAEADFIDRWIDQPPQTNEVRRSAVLVPVGAWLAARFGLPIRTSELGASGGLNLRWDRYAVEAAGRRVGAEDPVLTLRPDWRGTPPPEGAAVVAAQAGVDLNPLDPRRAADVLRLSAYLWPDQPERMHLTRAAIAAADVPVEAGDAVDWLIPRLGPVPGQVHLIYSTVAWQYFPAERQARGRAAIEAAGAVATAESPLAWFGMENDGALEGAALTLRLWPGDLSLHLGRADFHGRWVDWQAPLPDQDGFRSAPGGL